jgi:hypothetical protein
LLDGNAPQYSRLAAAAHHNPSQLTFAVAAHVSSAQLPRSAGLDWAPWLDFRDCGHEFGAESAGLVVVTPLASVPAVDGTAAQMQVYVRAPPAAL